MGLGVAQLEARLQAGHGLPVVERPRNTRGIEMPFWEMYAQPLMGPESVVSSPMVPMIANHSRIWTRTGMLRSVST